MAKIIEEAPEQWELRLYIAGETQRARAALDNLKRVCYQHLRDRCEIEVIDLSKHPELVAKNNITAIPTLVKELPLPVRTLIGDLSAIDKVLVGLDLKRKS